MYKRQELYPEAFRDRFLGGGDQKVWEFWQAMTAAEHPALDEHPLVTKESFQTKVVPLSLHGDGVPVSGVGKAWSQSVDCYSFSSLLSSGSTIFSNYVIFFIHKMLKVSGGHRGTFADVSGSCAGPSTASSLASGLSWTTRAFPSHPAHEPQRKPGRFSQEVSSESCGASVQTWSSWLMS